MRDPGRQQSKSRLLFLLHQHRLRFLQFFRARGDAPFQQLLIGLQLFIQKCQSLTGRFQQPRQCNDGPRRPAQEDERKDDGYDVGFVGRKFIVPRLHEFADGCRLIRRLLFGGIAGILRRIQSEDDVTDGMQAKCRERQRRRMTDRAHQQ